MKLNRLRWRMNEVRATKLKDQRGFPHQCCRAVRWCPHCVFGSKVGHRQVAPEEKSEAFPMTMMDYLGRGV